MVLDFGLSDSRGRRIGCCLCFWHVEARAELRNGGAFWPAIPAHFASTIQPTRDDRRFGHRHRKDHSPDATIEDVKADLLERAEQSYCYQLKIRGGK
jgi:hypothetical protein